VRLPSLYWIFNLRVKLCVIILIISLPGLAVFGQNVSHSDLPIELPNDTIIQKYTYILDSVQSSFYQSSNSLKYAYQSNLNKLNSVHSGLQNKLDSLSELQLPTLKIKHVLDSINQLREKTIASLKEKLQSIKDKTTGRIKELNLPPELSEKVSAITGNIENFSIPTTDFNFASVNLPDNPLEKLNDLNMKSSLSSVGKVDELKNVTGELSQISGITNEVSSYGQEAQQLAQGNLEAVKELPAAAEQKAAELSGFKDIQKQAGVLDEYKGDLGQLQNPGAMKDQGVEKLQQAAMDHFAGKGQIIQEAMDKMSKYKEKYESLNSLSDIPKKRPNEMRSKPLIERIIPAFMIQIQKEGNDLLIDLNPYVGYRFTGKLTAGPGWNQRIAYNTHGNAFKSKPRIFGPRAFAEYNLWKGFFPRVEVEIMNACVPPLTKPATIDLGNRQWVWGMFVGIKKEYRFLKTVKGTVLIMTRLFDPHHKSPYADVINARFGFEFPMKKKVKR